MNIFNIIIEQKLLEISIQSIKRPIEELKNMERENPIIDFKSIFKKKEIQIIPEIKQKLFFKDEYKDKQLVLDIINEYKKNGASSISLLTDNYFFDGSFKFINEVKKNVKLPILQKDFIISEYQIYQSYFYGTDAIILIAELLDYYQLNDYYNFAKEIGLQVLIQFHNADSLEKINKINPDLILASSRDMNTMKVNIKYFEKLYSLLPESATILVEGGVKTKQDLNYINNLNYKGAIIGTGLMKKENPGKEFKELLKGK
tara:strand:- start:1864 stop:2640 length:777 start_codon:yes stop_codon:yes gene_type:complete